MDPVIICSFFVIAFQGAMVMLFWRPLSNSHKLMKRKLRLVAAVIATAVTLISCLINIYYIDSFYRMGIHINPIGLVVCTVLTPLVSMVLYMGLGWTQQKAEEVLNRFKPRA